MAAGELHCYQACSGHPTSIPQWCGHVIVPERHIHLLHGCKSLDAYLSVQGGYMVLTVVMLDYLHDAWFYWTHRLLHWKPLYRHVHHLHHRYAPPPV